MKKLLLVFAMMPFLFTSCVGKKKLADLESQLSELQASSTSSLSKAKADLSDCQSLTASLQGELKKQRQDFFLAHRMEAYQRVILYMERIHPSSIVLRMNQPNMNALVLQTLVLKAIREEYDHNVAQQMFISSNAWNLLKNAKEETVKLINVAASQLGAEASANDLATAVITLSAEINPLPSEIAINALKAEFQQLF